MGPAGGLFISARSALEYCGMFDLRIDQWRDRLILDCPGGGASFTAEWRSAGVAALASDPIYMADRSTLASAVWKGVERAAANVAAEPERYVWSTVESPQAHRALREQAARNFLRDIHRHPASYVGGTLPYLPFPSGSFDLVLCSFLLFAYSETLDTTTHIEYARELVRVSRGEVRIYPLIGFEAEAPDLVGNVSRALEDRGCVVERRPCAYEFLRGATEYLRIDVSGVDAG